MGKKTGRQDLGLSKDGLPSMAKEKWEHRRVRPPAREPYVCSDINASNLVVEIKDRRFDQAVRRKRIRFLEKILLNIYVSFSILTLFWRNSQLGWRLYIVKQETG